MAQCTMRMNYSFAFFTAVEKAVRTYFLFDINFPTGVINTIQKSMNASYGSIMSMNGKMYHETDYVALPSTLIS